MGEIRWNSSGIKDFVGKEGVANQPVTINFSNFEIAQVACGAEFSLFLTRCGKVFGVGYNGYNQMGELEEQDGDGVDKFVYLKKLQQYEPIDKIGAGAEHSVFLSRASETVDNAILLANGYNAHNELSEKTENGGEKYVSMKNITDLMLQKETMPTKIIDIVCGSWSSCFLTSNHTAYVCGSVSDSCSNMEARKIPLENISQMIAGEYSIVCKTMDGNFHFYNDNGIKTITCDPGFILNRVIPNLDVSRNFGFEFFDKELEEWRVCVCDIPSNEYDTTEPFLFVPQESYSIFKDEKCSNSLRSPFKDIVLSFNSIVALGNDNALSIIGQVWDYVQQVDPGTHLTNETSLWNQYHRGLFQYNYKLHASYQHIIILKTDAESRSLQYYFEKLRFSFTTRTICSDMIIRALH